MTDPYKILGVNPNATDDEIKAAYRQLAKKMNISESDPFWGMSDWNVALAE